MISSSSDEEDNIFKISEEDEFDAKSFKTSLNKFSISIELNHKTRILAYNLSTDAIGSHFNLFALFVYNNLTDRL